MLLFCCLNLKKQSIPHSGDFLTQGTSTPTANEIMYIYDGMSIEGMVYTSGGTPSVYTFDKNPRGDVVAVLDNSGNIVVK